MSAAQQKFGKVAVLFGGRSGEREVSLKSGSAVLAALQRQGVDAHAFDPATQELSALKGYDRAFIALHGRFGEDGTIQGALELMDIPYTGSGVMASALGMDKWRTKLLWTAAGVVTPDFVLMDESTTTEEVVATLGLPVFVKPANEGSSIGVSKVKQAAELAAAYTLAKASDPLVIAEQFVGGGEYTVGILGDTALPVIRIVPKNEYYDYEAKYLRDDTEYRCPSGLSAAQEAQIQAEALQAFRVLGCSGWGRVDFLMDEAGKHYFLEVNTSPGMTDHSLVPMAAKAAGLDFDALVINILQQTLKASNGNA
ncbi:MULTISPECIES: D-alanine--D-alanine ligase [unclassified Methylophilus]|uniref:D-alanine--D-alanine ligase n=1 Tax=unclassified Methylophilus TaxID=2630143 RepID=UPI0006F23788|nr:MULTISPECIES: D-alanine--D-alanine ligase [unclassified Methylophilus]KQT42363.1 D-alanine--D-alanine ligase [Methylophilus sp. Leaf416]KQT56546.1 D-alanine--D-alanine ligase [Methylophilus sp. Leaf459]